MRGLPVLAAMALLSACTSGSSTQPPTTPPAPISSATLEAAITMLLNRPLHLPTVPPASDCPVTRARPLTAGEGAYTTNVFGTGPLYPLPAYLGPDTTLRLTGKTPAPDGFYQNKVVWVSKGGYTGPAIVRVAQLDGPARGQVKLYYEPTASRGDAVIFNLTNDPTNWPSGTFLPMPGCYAYQIDGTTFTDAIIFKVCP